MKTVYGFLILICSVILIMDIVNCVLGSYEYSKQIGSHWELAVKASTLEKKTEGVDNFVQALANSGLQGNYNAIWLETPNNSFDRNFEALLSLQKRLHEISKMDISSFQYQTALAQITQQEQNEAHEMLSVFDGVWWKEYHFWLWDWVLLCNLCVVVFGLLGVIFARINFDY